jgi:hypothetical protein
MLHNLLPVALIGYVIWNLVLYYKIRGLKRRVGPKPVELRCICKHLFTSHGLNAGCKEQFERDHYSPAGTRNGYEWVRCPCIGYLGPDPLILGYDYPKPKE